MTVVPAEPIQKPLITPLRAYLLVTILLVLLVTAPFTVGVGVAHVCDALARFDHAVGAWAEGSPLTSWLVDAAVGFFGMSYVGVLAMNDDAVFRTVRRGTAAVIGVIVFCVVLEYLFIHLPSMDALYAAFGAAGGTPAWLNGISTFIVVACANALHVSVVMTILVAFAAADFS
jgi:uncharacterized BrkB/YihY/UPF0761 family membrane protein